MFWAISQVRTNSCHSSHHKKFCMQCMDVFCDNNMVGIVPSLCATSESLWFLVVKYVTNEVCSNNAYAEGNFNESIQDMYFWLCQPNSDVINIVFVRCDTCLLSKREPFPLPSLNMVSTKLILLSMSCRLWGWYMTFRIFCVLGCFFEHLSVNIYNNLDFYLHSFWIWCISFSYLLKLCIILHALIGPLEYCF
jgi:hypothetical protein